MTVIDRTFDHVFEELRAERAGFGAAMRAERAELRAEMRAERAELRAEMRVLRDRLDRPRRAPGPHRVPCRRDTRDRLHRVGCDPAVIDERFERGVDEMRALRAEMHACFAQVHTEFAQVHTQFAQVHTEFAQMRADMSALQRQMMHIFAGFAIALLGVVGAGVVATL